MTTSYTLHFYILLLMGLSWKMLLWVLFVQVTTVYMSMYFCRMSPGSGFANPRVGVFWDFLDSANF